MMMNCHAHLESLYGFKGSLHDVSPATTVQTYRSIILTRIHLHAWEEVIVCWFSQMLRNDDFGEAQCTKTFTTDVIL
jgi:hypothetical protein